MFDWSTISDLSDSEKSLIFLRVGAVMKSTYPNSYLSFVEIVPDMQWSVYHISPTPEQAEHSGIPSLIRATRLGYRGHAPILEVRMNGLIVTYNDDTGETVSLNVGFEKVTDTLVIALPNKEGPCDYDQQTISKIHIAYLDAKRDLAEAIIAGSDTLNISQAYHDTHQAFIKMLSESKEAREYYRVILQQTNERLSDAT